MHKYLLITALIAFCSCQKQAQPIAEGIPSQEPTTRLDAATNINNENAPKEPIIESDITVITSHKIYSQEDIIGIWLQGTPFSFREIEFTNSDIFYLREFDRDYTIVDEKFYPYKIEGKKLIIDDAGKSNDFGYDINTYFLSSGEGIYIDELDDRKLYFKIPGASFLFYKGSMDDFLGREAIRLSYENKLKDFIHNEMLNGIIFQGDIHDENAVIAIYGEPIKDEIINNSGVQGFGARDNLTDIREISYEDLTHRYYVLSGNYQIYADIVLTKNLDRLTIPIIGASSEDVTAEFGSSYWHKNGEDFIYMWGSDWGESYRWVKFSVENNVVISVSYIITESVGK
jgi:hypothetical protein